MNLLVKSGYAIGILCMVGGLIAAPVWGLSLLAGFGLLLWVVDRRL